MKFIDMFCGIGTVRMGMEQAGHECVCSIEWDKHKRKIYSIIFGKEPEYAVICSVGFNDLPRADCWTFGAPCQDFSIAGKREGLEGNRSSMVLEVFRLIRETEEKYRPKYLVYENVKGMLSSNKGFDYLKVLSEMDSLGYDIEWQLLNSKNFGVPQNRERVFTIGHSRRYSARKIFPITESSGLHNESDQVGEETHETALCLTAKGQTNWTGSFVLKQLNKVKCLNSKDKNGKQPQQHDRVYATYGLMTSLMSSESGGRFNVLIPEVTKKGYAEAFEGDSINLAVPNSKTRRGRVGKGIANTLDTSCNQATLSQGRIRRLTPKECMRLQGVPDYITDKLIVAGISDTQIYRGAGDACTTTVIYQIAKRMGENYE